LGGNKGDHGRAKEPKGGDVQNEVASRDRVRRGRKRTAYARGKKKRGGGRGIRKNGGLPVTMAERKKKKDSKKARHLRYGGNVSKRGQLGDPQIIKRGLESKSPGQGLLKAKRGKTNTLWN